MIKYNNKSWFNLIFAFRKSDTLRILWKEILYMGIFSATLSFALIEYGGDLKHLQSLLTVYSLIGFVISLLLVFRTNTAYDRWWEGRKKWGALVNDTRNLAIKISTIVKNKEAHVFFAKAIPNFVFATKEHLREGVEFDELEGTKEEIDFLKTKSHVPNAISQSLYDKLHDLKSKGEITQEEFITIDHNANALLDSLGACERIKNTPIPFSYSLFIKKFIFLYVSTIPLGIIPLFGYGTVLITMFMFYVLVSMEILAEEIEDPFGKDASDLPTDELCVKIRGNVKEIFNEA
jgi:putative membrane protein